MKRKIMSLCLVLVLALSICNFKAVAATKTYKINNTVLEFNEIFYVDSLNGLDTNDGLTPETAFKTIAQYTKQTVENSACILADGTHDVSGTALHNNTNFTKTFIGNGLNTIIANSSSSTLNFQFSNKNTYTNFIKLTIRSQMTGSPNYGWSIAPSNGAGYCTFKNVLWLKGSATVPYAMITYHTSSESATKKYVEYENCSMVGGGDLRGFHSATLAAAYEIEMVNCVVPISNDINGAHIAVNQTNLISAIDNQGNSLVSEELWEHVGTGLNPDGTQAHIGVYGGEFAWGDWDSDAKPRLSVLLEVDEEVQLSVTDILADNIDYTWTSSDSSIAAVDASGKVKAINEGVAAIYARNTETGFDDFINIKVVGDGQAAEERLTVDLRINQTAKLYLKDEPGIVWTSFDDSVVTVDSAGKITGVSPGLAIVESQYEGESYIMYVRVK